jgi:hypothetical protein
VETHAAETHAVETHAVETHAVRLYIVANNHKNHLNHPEITVPTIGGANTVGAGRVLPLRQRMYLQRQKICANPSNLRHLRAKRPNPTPKNPISMKKIFTATIPLYFSKNRTNYYSIKKINFAN